MKVESVKETAPVFNPEDPKHLRLLATWFDVTRPGGDDEVQRDLRRITDAIEQLSI